MRAAALAVLAAVVLAGCETPDTQGRAAAAAAIRQEPPGDYYVGRRMYKREYKVWGWVRRPGQPWRTAKLVMLNEQRKMAPDREQGKLGADNSFEYRLYGAFSGETVYEPASDRFYPEFVLTGYEVVSMRPPNIYATARQNDPAVRLLQPPP